MRTLKAVAIFGVLVLAILANSAQARARVGVVIGMPGPWYPYSGYYYPPPYYYPPAYSPVYSPVYVTPPAPPVYVDRQLVQESGDNYWYFCPDAKAYYPYVKQCPGGWTRVPPTPPGAP